MVMHVVAVGAAGEVEHDDGLVLAALELLLGLGRQARRVRIDHVDLRSPIHLALYRVLGHARRTRHRQTLG